MRAPRPFQSIVERIDEAIQTALDANRNPVALVLGKEDYSAFATWAREVQQWDIDSGDRYRDMPVRLNDLVFLSCLELQPTPGLPNALRL